MRLFGYDMLINVNSIYYAHVCEQARWAHSAGNSAIENISIIIIIVNAMKMGLVSCRAHLAKAEGFVISRSKLDP